MDQFTPMVMHLSVDTKCCNPLAYQAMCGNVYEYYLMIFAILVSLVTVYHFSQKIP